MGFDLCFNGLPCNATTLRCACEGTDYGPDLFIYHNANNCVLPNNFYLAWLIYICILASAIITALVFELKWAKLKAKELGLLAIAMVTTSIVDTFALYFEKGMYAASSIFYGMFIMFAAIVMYKFVFLFVSPIFAVRRWDLEGPKRKARPIIFIASFTIMSNALAMAVLAHRGDHDGFNIAFTVSLAQIALLGSILGLALAYFAFHLWNEITRIGSAISNESMNRKDLRSRIVRASFAGVFIVVACVCFVIPMIVTYVALKQVPYSFVLGMLAFHSVLALGVIVAAFLHQAGQAKTGSRSQTGSARKECTAGSKSDSTNKTTVAANSKIAIHDGVGFSGSDLASTN